MKESTNILPLDHGTLDRYVLKASSEVDVNHIRISEVFSILFQKCMVILWSVKSFKDQSRLCMHAQSETFENFTVDQTTGRNFSVVKLRKLQNH